jgi:hypothetical protein
MKSAIRGALVGSSLAVLAAVAVGCSAPELADDRPVQTTVPESAPPPPAPPPQSYAVEPPAPAPIGDNGLLGGPTEDDTAPAVIASTPVPNPEDLSKDERERIYGPDHPHHPARARAGRLAVHRHDLVRSARIRHGTRAHRPLAGHAAHRAVIGRGLHHPAILTRRSARHARPQVLTHHPRAAPVPHAAAVSKAPNGHTAATPAAAPATKLHSATPAASPTKLDQLAASLRPDLTSGAKLTIPAEVSAGKPGVVSLTLPATLLDRLTAEAGKQGLARDAQTADVGATLRGAGSSIVPNGVQTARLKSGEAASFNWQVTPGTPNPALAAEVGATLKGGVKPETVSIGQVAAPSPAASDDAAKAPSNPLTSFQDKQAGASAQTGLLILLGLGLLVVVLVLAMVNRMRRDERLAERRRKARALDEARARTAHDAHPSASHADRHTPETV